MPGKIKRIINLVGNMGWRYLGYRLVHEFTRRTGLLKARFPTNTPFQRYISLETWKQTTVGFFFNDKTAIQLRRNPEPHLKETFQDIQNGKLLLFNSISADLGKKYDWVTNPDTGFHYDVGKHWTQIADYSKSAGDIKYVWEKSRFSYLYDIIRYDFHFNEDCASFIFQDILSWIESNPVNCGPNYRCSQEMSLRVLNWTFALFYYKHSPYITDQVFDKIQYAIYWHLHHIFNNINFSRIAVRNNHAITETLTLYLAGLFYPQMLGAATWKEKGRKWFEQEIAYQVYDDGTFLQFSMNYHRIVVQLLTWAITLSEKNGERFSEVVYDRARKSLEFLRTCMVDYNGWLPNYGANDGALFFKLSSTHYRDYRPQLDALAAALGLDLGPGGVSEDRVWYGISNETKQWLPKDGISCFKTGGYFIIREPETLTFIKCGGYKDRPSQADNLHLDIWYKGENILIDAGSYKYNTDDATSRYFTGTESHNTVMLDGYDQMLKGGRFIWYYWSQCLNADLKDHGDQYIFEGAINAFRYISDNIIHERRVVKKKGVPVWEVTDRVIHVPAHLGIIQSWHLPLKRINNLSIEAETPDGADLTPQMKDGWYSSLYGRKEKSQEVFFKTGNFGSYINTIKTIIKVDVR